MSEKKLEKNTLSHSLHEECGVFGMYDLDGNDVASTITMDFLLYSTVDRRAVELRSATHADLRVRSLSTKIWGWSMRFLHRIF